MNDVIEQQFRETRTYAELTGHYKADALCRVRKCQSMMDMYNMLPSLVANMEQSMNYHQTRNREMLAQKARQIANRQKNAEKRERRRLAAFVAKEMPTVRRKPRSTTTNK